MAVPTAKASAKREKDLYPAITALLRGRGFDVWEEATIRAGDEGTRTADHVGWMWDGSEIDACAVEVKAGRADLGFAQAVSYAVGFPRVFVAAEEPLAETGYLRQVFERLGLGYIHVSPEQASIELEAKRDLFVNKDVHTENIARIRVKHLSTAEVLGEPVRFGRDKRGHIWAVTGTTSVWQLAALVVTDKRTTWLCLLTEGAGLGRSFAARIDAANLAGLLRSLDTDKIVLELRERTHKGYQPQYSPVLETWRPAEPTSALLHLLARARKKMPPRTGPRFQVLADFWPNEAELTEDEALDQFKSACSRLRNVRDELNRITFSSGG
jgi:hypothetical protein